MCVCGGGGGRGGWGVGGGGGGVVPKGRLKKNKVKEYSGDRRKERDEKAETERRRRE